MKTIDTVLLSPLEIEKLTSHYLYEGRKQETWKIENIAIEDSLVTAKTAMSSMYISDTDTQGFHLSFITALEMISQLTIVYLHHKAGLKSKSREVWMSEGRSRFIRPIRNPQDIRLEMRIEKLRKHGNNLYCIAGYKVTDNLAGLCEYWGKAYLL